MNHAKTLTFTQDEAIGVLVDYLRNRRRVPFPEGGAAWYRVCVLMGKLSPLASEAPNSRRCLAPRTTTCIGSR